jgi:AcrR family transcriptional regulator
VVDEQTIELIAQRVIAAIREDLDAIASGVTASSEATEQLTVGQVARQLGVSRSTVYAHWREWGGYKLGLSDKAPIRFDSNALLIARRQSASRALADRSATQPPAAERKPTPRRARSRRRRRDLITDTPRLVQAMLLLDGV